VWPGPQVARLAAGPWDKTRLARVAYNYLVRQIVRKHYKNDLCVCARARALLTRETEREGGFLSGGRPYLACGDRTRLARREPGARARALAEKPATNKG
jgi:hypothetical protein